MTPEPVAKKSVIKTVPRKNDIFQDIWKKMQFRERPVMIKDCGLKSRL